ncbi:peptidoglycan DD-metalloendopeptidase family protein [Streptomyces fulvorobeus]|uniref:Murein DD-endopeptidase MepM/ murein hydrolase activator NlpD/SLT domain-containing protein n=1 Tax=Streptomyces fulvorobeus TaxID=284028 RepID=A0A7J0CE24_9ACTN|nr:peptidoglycan DD-metalloendopeptidase family protein [Streptomyces fulvorobeus]NYE44203.1 murein DD-endopeptidase MepM/ murein hydrolase activator NlpD/SLT domain-containing protein [Streptomyces fulvorobeus]GFN00716.1 hypothetical protein Sfulv_55260 [Streptomyces fulvorobeus]
MPDLDIVGGAAVDVVPVIPQFHAKLKALVLPIADRVGEEAGRRMGDRISRNIVIAIPDAITRGGRAGVTAAGRQGDDAGGAFARSIRRKLEAAFKAMPKLNIRLGDTGVDAELNRLRARMESLRNKTIGIDVSTADAEREIVRIDAELKRLGASHADVDVRADTATARAALAAIRAEIQAVDAKEVRIPVRVDSSQATSALMSLGIQVAALTAIPLGPVLAAGLGAVVSMATAAGAGVAAVGLAAIPAIKGVTEALSAKSAAEKEASTATDQGTASTSKAASKALQMAGAQSALSAAHRNAAQSIVSGTRAIEDAERAVAQAVQRASDQRRQSTDAIRRAQQSLAESHRRVRDAQESLTDANENAEEAEQSLTRARQDAARTLKDLSNQLTNGALDQREAAIRVREAREELARAAVGRNAGLVSQLDFDQAQLAYDQAIQSQKEQSQGYKDLQTSAAKQQKAGIEGSDAVKDAADRLADAQGAVRDQLEAVKDAQRAVRDSAIAVADAQSQAARDQREAATSVASAQRGVADAVQDAANAQISAAESIASAERGVASARLSGIDTTTKAISKSDEYKKALAGLSAPQRDLFEAIAGPKGLKVAFDEWQKSLQPEVLPLFTRGIDGAKKSLPGLTPLVTGAAKGIETLMDKASAQLKTPFWVSFKKDLAESVQPAVEGFGTAFGNVIKGIAGVIDAFLPKMDGIASRSDSITGRFAKWGSSLKGSPAFEKFLQYVKDTSPGLAAFLGDIMRTLLDISKALAPLSETMFEVLGPMLDAVSWLAVNAPGLVITLWSMYFAQKAIALGMAAFAGAMILYQTVIAGAILVTSGWAVAINATGIVPVIRAIVLIVALLVAAVIYAYKNWAWFRIAVDSTARAIKTAALWIWDEGLKPAFAGIWTGMQAIGTAAIWLWDKALEPSFRFISDGSAWLAKVLIAVLLLPAYLAFQQLGAIGMWLWEKSLGPALGWVGAKAMWLWDKALKPSFQWIGDKATWLNDKAIRPAMKESAKNFQALGDAGSWLWNKILKPIFQWIGDKATWLYDKAIKPAFDAVKFAMGRVADSFRDGKNSIKKSWDQIQDIAKKPVKFIIDHVYNDGIVPLWNKVAAITGSDKLKKLTIKGFHTGGIMSGYSPGRDDRVVAVGGGEAIMRPEWTRAVGADRINAWNAAARSGGIGGVQKAISDGMPAYKDGGIVGWFKDKANDVGSFVSGAAGFMDPTNLFDKATKFVASQMKPLLTSPWSKSVAQIPSKMLSGLKDKALDFFGFGGGGGSGQWIKPVNAAYGTPFGKKGSMWSSGQHTGLDFPAAVGAAVKAVAAGKVAMAKSGGPYGNHMMVSHGGGLTSLYAHLSKMLASSGESVKQGEQIGAVGSTGNSSGPHLHLEARVNGRAVDPMSYINGGGGSSGGSGVQRWRSVVQQALKLTGNPAGFADLTLRRMNQESGGNPTAVNNWDINAKNGTPSVGLMQVIKPTFDAYAASMRNVGPKMHGVSTNPLANVYASMRYAKSRYGSLPAAYNKPGGYYEGGFPQLGETAWVGEKGPELLEFLTPTRVHSSRDSMAVARQAKNIPAASGGMPPAVNVEARFYMGNREVTDLIRTEIDVYDADTGRALETGRII